MDDFAFEQLLDAIEAEPAPERLLELARELQVELQKKRLSTKDALDRVAGGGLSAK